MINLKLKKSIFRVVLLLLSFIVVFIIAFNLRYNTEYLKEHGYSIKDIPRTIAVSLNLSDGFVLSEKSKYGYITIIGDEKYETYENIFAEMGYYEIDRAGSAGFFAKNNDSSEQSYFIFINEDSYHWFRAYEINDENILKDYLG